LTSKRTDIGCDGAFEHFGWHQGELARKVLGGEQSEEVVAETGQTFVVLDIFGPFEGIVGEANDQCLLELLSVIQGETRQQHSEG
jgi:hypothetical protein